MIYDVLLRDTTTGEERAYLMDHLGPWDENSDYIWADGNYACDCNRSLFFARAIKTPEAEINESPCGHTRFLCAVRICGTIVYADDAW